MRFRILMAFLLAGVFLSVPIASCLAQKNIAEILEEKETKSSGMKSKTFKKSPPKAAEEKASAPDEEKDYEEISEEKTTTDLPKEKSAPPEEDVWKKYKSLAAGTQSKPMGRHNYSMSKKFSKKEDTEGQEGTSDEEDTEIKKKGKKKSGIAGILEDYMDKKKKNTSIKSRTVNE